MAKCAKREECKECIKKALRSAVSRCFSPCCRAGVGIESPAEISIPLTQNGLPSSVKLRARYLDHNNPVGSWSDVVTVQTIP